MFSAFNPSRLPKDKLIITLIDTKININSSGFYCNLGQDLLDKLQSCSLLRRKSLVYKLFINSHEKQLICPMLKFPEKKNVVLWPSIKLPYRKYPVYVYIYAAALYLTSKISMREAALKVRQKFRLESFSHSTLSRILRKLSLNIYELLSIAGLGSPPADSSPPLIERAHWSVFQINI
ncbi:hypothetical protein [Desulfolucanica intricata]|uniref:hypothetical protein n=1 Tax=Desulfolucanica intricata TaxID=1285191 RepID=UPI00082AF8A9|nr:hypothetical protein [Desulfolucanica intricata]